jgi:hypothetical protein
MVVVVVIRIEVVVVGGAERSDSYAPRSGALPIIRGFPSKSVEGSSGTWSVPLSIQGESPDRW